MSDVSTEHRVLLLGSLVVLLLIMFGSGVRAASNSTGNFTPYIPPQTNIVHVNQTYIIADQSAMSAAEFFTELVIGMLLFFASCILSLYPKANEVDALISAMSAFPLFVAAFSATSIDFVTSYGVSAITGINNTPEWILLENHTIYHFDITGIVLWIFSFISVLNTIRIILNHRRLDALMLQGQNPD